MKKAITQEHPMGCAVACTAYILGCSYQEALRYYQVPKQAWERGFYCKEVIAALRKAGKNYSYDAIKTVKRKLLKLSNIIVFVERSIKYPAGHFLVKTDSGLWMNPWCNYPMIVPAISGLQKKLPGKPKYVIFPIYP